MNKQQRLDKIFINIALEFATLSHCVTYKVGAVAVNDNRIIATGINGTPEGMLNCDRVFKNYNSETDREEHHMWSEIHELHAELNVILFCAKNGISLKGTTVYSTVQPCQQCLKNMLQCGIVRIVYKYPYEKAVESKLIKEYMKEKNIIIEQIEE